ncbi:MAG: ABC transporter ATP-binding protein [Alphaproteobacteria bacterium]|nr:ABC transporter ATP-binding protein [Alphaproteobacteria bacterium]
MTVLSIRSLVKRFQSVVAVDNASLQTREGELISLLGPSGCGKTTTLWTVAGFETPDSGTVHFDGVDVTNLLPEQRDVGMVFQNYALFPHMTVYANCLFGLEMRGVGRDVARQRITKVLDMVQLTGLETRYPRELSGGQQQRVALARALVIEPAVLLLDEPLANLDAVLRDEMRFFIRSLQQRVGITTLYVTHDQSEALLISDRIAVMFEGRIEQIGTPDEIYARPITQRVARFVGLSNLLAGKLRRQAGGFAIVESSAGPIRAIDNRAIADGAAATLLVRPEMISLGDGPESAEANRFTGTVEDSFFLGSVVDYRIRTVDGLLLQVHGRPVSRLAKGASVTVSFLASATWILAA